MQVSTNNVKQSEVLVGQMQPAKGFEVSNDPRLMAMLSTGFYKDPRKAMIRETLFNAWDAHKAKKCTDIALDVYVNETSGLIVKDYGFGIPNEDMHSRYCVYGGTTKLNDSSQTGGFGLGCKSPFAYTESFTVTSANQGRKNVYLISRVSDETGGTPGITRLLDCPTEDTGLMVTIPLKNYHHQDVYNIIKDLIEFSGIRMNLHYLDKEIENLFSTELAPGEYEIKNNHRSDTLYAVYGGVSYRIPKEDSYSYNYEFLKKLTNNESLYIGFTPNSLTPLPSREGLNMSKNSQ